MTVDTNTRVALVSGGTTGIGRGITRSLLEAGYRVVATGLTEDEGKEAHAALADVAGVAERLRTITLDVRSRDDCAAAVQFAVDTFGGLDVLASNAGIFPQARLADMSDEDMQTMFDVNLYGTIRLVQAARPALKKSDAGRVVLTSSITGSHTGYPGWSHYGASKAAQQGFMRSAAMELAVDGITVNAVLPGNIVTPGLEALGEAYLARMAESVPLGHLGQPEDVGAAVVFLASPSARYITGHAIVVDGGQILPESPDALKDMRVGEAG